MNMRDAFSDIEVQASEWVVAMHDRSVPAEQRARFAQWLAADPEHERIYRVQKSAWAALAGMGHLLDVTPPVEVLQPPQRLSGRWHRWRVPAAAAAVLLVGLAVLLGGVLPGSLTSRAHVTAAGQVKDIRLRDGTLMTLGASSRAEVRFTAKRRQVRLLAGEAFFEVTRDTARPFFVQAGDAEVRVVGTQFDVHLTPETVRVSVLEGRVEVREPPADRAQPRTAAQAHVLTAGESVTVGAAPGQPQVRSVSTVDLGAWRTGRLVYVDASLRDVIADVNRYHDGRIRLGDAGAGDLQLTTAFRVDQIDRMIDVLTAALPLRAEREGEQIVLLLR